MSAAPVFIVYDGECPFCSSYVRFLNLRKALGAVELVDARSGHPVVQRLLAAGYDLDEGMALVDGDTIHHGEACINRLALMSTSSGWFNRLNAAIFRNRAASRALYPLMRAGRNGVLAVMGRKRIRDAA